ncbi:MAG: hypothetical protein ACI35R_08160 [Bacillus sp. (in: firmicutes)]
MIGILLADQEQEEMEYLLKREMDEMLEAFKDGTVEPIVKRAMEERYKILFTLFSKLASREMCMRYIRLKKQ